MFSRFELQLQKKYRGGGRGFKVEVSGGFGFGGRSSGVVRGQGSH